MKLKQVVETLSQEDLSSRRGIFYNPRTLVGSNYAACEAVIANHANKPMGYLLFCDCSRIDTSIPVSEAIQAHSM